jgi:hypothetical protein
VIHSHAKEVVLASLLYKGKEFRIKNQHMIKGIWNNVEGRPGDKIITRLRLKKLGTNA